jgi:uncharacterized protein
VLFPRGVLPLRVFETRYVDMVRECMKSSTPFGVVAIRAGNEVGTAAEPYDVGTLAHIIACDVEDLGVLLLHTQGGERFRIIEKRTQRNQLIEARIAPLPVDDPGHTGESLTLCAKVLQVVIDELHRRAGDLPDAISSIHLPSRMRSTAQPGSRTDGARCCRSHLKTNRNCWN